MASPPETPDIQISFLVNSTRVAARRYLLDILKFRNLHEHLKCFLVAHPELST
jgi:hypothetical protein